MNLIVERNLEAMRRQMHCQHSVKDAPQVRVVPHPLAVTIDHVIPLSCGGEHSYRNTQLACFRCNSIKGNGSVDGGEQLRLF
ncbi:HNH endonuclease [Candidatus Babeliales bacterium]|nr:HNH endonuclease [Candidatus Babeliales bacterium]